ncbi:hypothetical protein HdyHp2_065 [Haloarcula virus Hardyhisp2]|uniref:Uncharacterized protein n=1 Tax=Haloarcula virus Hardyhisp2 TaxID=2811386 RepID=A0A898KCU8_9VIRU|nr:hypothetical protein QIT44_gp13 [Haloarcula virus Hardyhisp2]QSJ05033.1 hypothetical protein HdyHp2_065 [Haloarcula virus Hardyhisp2]
MINSTLELVVVCWGIVLITCWGYVGLRGMFNV